MQYKEYKVISVEEGACGTILVGSSMIPLEKMEAVINSYAKQGWSVVFQILEKKRFMLFWQRESIIITFGR